MSCTINTIRKEAYHINPKAKFDTLGVYIPFDYNVKNKGVRFYRAKNEAAKLLKELNVRFNSLEFGSVGGLNTNYTDGVGISLKVPKKLDKAFQLREGNITAVEYLKYVAEMKEQESFADPEIHEEQDFRDEITYNELNSELIRELGDEEVSYLALQEQEMGPMRFAINNRNSNKKEEKSWKQARIDLIENLEKTKTQYFNKDQEKVNEINELVKTLRKELEEFDETNKDYIKNSILKEIETLKNIISDKDLTAEEKARALDINQVTKRIEDLKAVFEGEKEDVRTNRFKNVFNEEEFGYLKSEVQDLKDFYDGNLEAFIKSLILDNDIVKNALYSPEKTEADREAFQAKIDELLADLELSDGGKYEGEFLGDRSYDNILVELGALIKEVNKNKEVSLVSSLKAKLDPLFYKIRDKKVGDDLLTDRMFKKDMFGVITDTLITPFTDFFIDKSKLVKEAKKRFLEALYTQDPSVGIEYKNMMDNAKLYYDYIKPYMIPSVARAFSKHHEFESFFTASESEMVAYEAEMREKMGNIAFDISIKKSVAGMKRFLEDPETSAENRSTVNPLEFIKHFYSPNYQSYNPTSFKYQIPKYASHIPSLGEENYKKFYSQDFKEIEDAKVESFPEFYQALSDVLMYVKPRNPRGSFNSIMNLRDDVGRMAMQDLTKMGKVSKWIITAIKNLYKNLVDNGSFENRDGLKAKSKSNPLGYDFKANRKIKDISSYGKSEYYKMKKTYLNWSISDLQKEADAIGLKYNPRKINLDVFKEEFVEAIIQANINKSSSLDLLKRIHVQLDAVQSRESRSNSEAGYELLKDFIKTREVSGLNVSEQLKTSMLQNLYQIGHKGEDTPIAKFERIVISSSKKAKVYSPVEKKLKEVWEKEKKNSNDSFNFEHQGKIYETQVDENTKEKTYYETDLEGNIKELEKNEIDRIYKEYLDVMIDNLGLSPIVGSVIKGLTNNMYKHFLSVSGITGIKNRMAGFHQNNAAAASGIRGFNTKDLFVARKFLFGTNFGKYTGNKTFSAEKTKQLGIFQTMLTNFNLLDKVYDEIVGENTGVAKISLLRGKFKEFLGDFSMNNPEYHNQGELLLAMLQNVKIEKKVNNKIEMVPFFDPKTGKLPLDKNMNFLPAFDTEKNKKGWLSEEDSNQLSSFVSKYRNVKDKLHGDYSGDKIGMETSASSKASVAMLKWAFENFNNQWGTKQISLATGDINIKGRKIVLAEHAPVLGIHVVLQNLKWAGIIGGVLGSSVVAGGLAVGGVLASILAYKMLNKNNNISFKMAKSDWSMSMGYLIEALAKTGRTFVNSNTGYKFDIGETKLEAWGKNKGSQEISKKDRAIISESAQEVADKMNTMIRFGIMGVTLKYMMMALLTDDDDDPKEVATKMKHYEGYLNYLINMRTSMTTEIDQWTDPTKVMNILESQIFLNYLKRGYINTSKSIERFEEGSISGGEFVIDMTTSVGGLSVGFPSKIGKLSENLFTDKYTGSEKILRNFSADRVYDTSEETWFDDYLKDFHLTGEEYHKHRYTKKRKKVRNALESTFRKKIISYWKKQGTFKKNSYKLDATTSKMLSKFLRNEGANANKYSYKSLDENLDWDRIIEKAENLEFD